MTTATIIIVTLIILIIIFGGNNRQRRHRKEIQLALDKVQAAFAADEITEDQNNILVQRVQDNWEWRLQVDKKIQAFKFLRQHQAALLAKYGEEVGDRLISHRYWIGMTEEQLLDCKGQPDKIEKQVLKTKTKVTFVYGNKSSGDYFVLENGQVVKFVDR
jgi:hypothetical protein